MDISHAAAAPAPAPTPATAPTPTGATPKSPEADPETPTRIQPGKPIPFSNGVLKRHHVNHHDSTVVTYKECLKNHAAGLGGHALDGCGEFMPDPNSSPSDPTSLKCAACGCHRNFHRRDPDDSPPTAVNPSRMIEFQPHHRHHPPPPHPPPPPPPPPHHRRRSSPDSSSPPPISSSYYPSAPHMLLALSTTPLDHAPAPPSTEAVIFQNPSSNTNSRKRFRTKFSPYQKQRMLEFAERVGWKMLRREDETVILDFCNQIGVERNVLKVWMHNNKSTLGKKESVSGGDGDGDGKHDNNDNEEDDDNDNSIDVARNTNASSSSS